MENTVKKKHYAIPPFNKYILPNRILCSAVGIWPIEENSSVASILFAYFRTFFSLTAVSSVLIPEILEIAMNWGDLTILTGVGCVSTTVGQLLFKMIYLLARRKRSIRLYRDMRQLWEISDIPEDRTCFEYLAYRAKIFTVGFYMSCMCNVITFSVAAGIIWIKKIRNTDNDTTVRLHLPFQVWYGPGELESPTYEIAFVLQFLASLICCAAISGLDATCMTLILHVCGQFKLIQIWIRKTGFQIHQASMKNDTFYLMYQQKINQCICHHQRMIELVNEVNALLSPIIFIQLLTSGLEICLSGYALTTGTTGVDLLKFTSYLLSMLVQLVVWCWPAEILIQESEQVGNIAYSDVPWYLLPAAYQRDLSLMIIRSQKNCHIVALTSQTISISTLTNVFNTAASYFTLLRQIQQSSI